MRPSNLIRSLISSRPSFVRGVLSTCNPREIVDLATTYQSTLPISHIAPSSKAIAIISELEADNRLPGKSMILMG